MRREQPCDIVLRKGRGRAQDQFAPADGFGDIVVTSAVARRDGHWRP
jgi:hypothetical protein